ncbi:unnamed protein product [Discula destructiva]
MSSQLDSKYQAYLGLLDRVFEPGVPQLTLEISPYMADNGAELSRTMPYSMKFTLTYQADETISENLICKWKPWSGCFANANMVLLHEKSPTQLEPVTVDMLQEVPDETGIEAGPMHSSSVFTVGAQGTHAPVTALTGNYQTKLIPGETYHLLYPGGHIHFWEIGQVPGDPHARLKRQKHPIYLPPAGPIVFTVVEESKVFPDRPKYLTGGCPYRAFHRANLAEANWRHAKQRALNWLEPKAIPRRERQPGAPLVNVSIDLVDFQKEGWVKTCTRVTYQAGSDVRPIIFHTQPILMAGLGFYHLRNNKWREVEDDNHGCYMITDGPDEEVKVGGQDTRSERFVSLQPGESWSYVVTWEVDKDVKVGDRLKFQFKGAVVDWWDWGSKEEQ